MAEREVVLDGLVIGGPRDGRVMPFRHGEHMVVPLMTDKGMKCETYKRQEFFTVMDGETPKVFTFWVPFEEKNPHEYIMRALTERYQEGR